MKRCSSSRPARRRRSRGSAAAPGHDQARGSAQLPARPARERLRALRPDDGARQRASSPPAQAWPYASTPPPAAAPLPDVPTLILSGAQDLRTPTSNALKVAARIPGASVEVVPFTGHSVIGSDLTGCAGEGARELLRRHQPVAPCTGAKDVLAPTPVTPAAALGDPPAGAASAAGPGRTLVAVLDTLARPQPPGDRGHAPGRRDAAERGELRRAARRLRAAERLLGGAARPVLRRRRAALRHRSGSGTAGSARARSVSAARAPPRAPCASGSSSRRVTGTLGGQRFDLQHRARAGSRAPARRRMAHGGAGALGVRRAPRSTARRRGALLPRGYV